VTLERLLGSWLERLLSRRRTRELFLGIFVLSAISIQFIVPFVQRHEAAVRSLFARIQPYFAWLPPSLASKVVAGAAQHDSASWFIVLAGFSAYALLSSVLLWQRFATQYRGKDLSESAAPERLAKRSRASSSDSEAPLTVLSPAVAAVVRKEFR